MYVDSVGDELGELTGKKREKYIDDYVNGLTIDTDTVDVNWLHRKKEIDAMFKRNGIDHILASVVTRSIEI